MATVNILPISSPSSSAVSTSSSSTFLSSSSSSSSPSSSSLAFSSLSFRALRLGNRALQKKKPELTADQLQEIKEAFQLFDTEKKGTIDLRELRASMKALGFDTTKEEIKKLLQDAEVLSEGVVTLEEFIKLVTPKMSLRDTKEEIDKVFDLFDQEHTVGHLFSLSPRFVCSAPLFVVVLISFLSITHFPLHLSRS